MLDNTKTREGYGIWKWHSITRSWKAINGRANFLAVGSDGKPYAIRASGEVFWPDQACENPIRILKPKKEKPINHVPCRNFSPVMWQRQAGRSRDISIGADGSIWALGSKKVPGGYEIDRWTG